MKRLFFLLSVVFSLSVFADDLDQIKASILSDCDLLDSRLSSIKSDSQSIINSASVGVAYSRQLYGWPDDVSSLNSRQKSYIKGMADKWQEIDTDISSSASNVVSLADSLSTVVSSIRTSANSITSSSDGSCNCDLTPVITAINNFKSQEFDNWYNFFIEFADVPEDVHFLKSNIESIKYSVEYIDDSVLYIKTYLTNQIPLIRNSLSSINSSLVSIDSKLDSFTNFNASVDIDLSSITNRLDTIISIESTISGKFETLFSALSDIQTSLDYNNFLLEHGFFNVTNQLEEVIFSIDSIFTNKLYWFSDLNNSYATYTARTMTSTGSSSVGPHRYLSEYRYSSIEDALKVISSESIRSGYSLNNYFYDFSFRRFPVLTNTVGALTRASTNFFSFFRGEIGVHGVLEDWTAQNGSYHDFLTNHYIQVVTGGTLSGNQSTKTNWFSRIETLLASLVFIDSKSTNTVDSSSAEQQANQITSHFSEISSSASNVGQVFSEQSQDIVELYRSWCQQFDSAALPSHVVLFTLPSEGEEIVVQFSLSDTPEIVAMVEGMRAITTFCWASVGIFFLYKFLVWSARCVFVACQFIYKAISSVFK